jgi:hypothetical protein
MVRSMRIFSCYIETNKKKMSFFSQMPIGLLLCLSIAITVAFAAVSAAAYIRCILSHREVVRQLLEIRAAIRAFTGAR